MEIKKLNEDYTPQQCDQILDIRNLQHNYSDTKIALLRGAQLCTGKNGLFLALTIQDGANHTIPGYYFQEDAETLYANWDKYRNTIVIISYDCGVVHDKKTLTIRSISFTPREVSDEVKKTFFRLVDSQREANINQIFEYVESLGNKELRFLMGNNSKILNYLQGYNPAYMNGEFGSHAELTKNIVVSIVNLSDKILNKNEKIEAIATFILVESALYSETMREYSHYDFIRVAKFIGKLQESLQESAIPVNPISLNGYLCSRMGITADNTTVSCTLFNLYESFDSILRLNNELNSLSIKNTSLVYEGTRIFR